MCHLVADYILCNVFLHFEWEFFFLHKTLLKNRTSNHSKRDLRIDLMDLDLSHWVYSNCVMVSLLQ